MITLLHVITRGMHVPQRNIACLQATLRNSEESWLYLKDEMYLSQKQQFNVTNVDH